MYREKKRYGQDPTVVVRSKNRTFRSPLRWKDGRMIFVCSWSDFFHKDADEWRPEAWEIIRATPHHTYQIPTKRTERILPNLPRDWGDGWPHVWLGASVESQEYIHRVDELLPVPASLHFLSIEPILGPVRLFGFGSPTWGKIPPNAFLDWVIVGDESGPDRREADLDWIRSLRDQCQAARVPFFFKQWRGTEMPELDGKVWDEIPDRRVS